MTSKRALITGCSTGIGRATAIELSQRGYDVIATARRPETIEDLDVAGRLACGFHNRWRNNHPDHEWDQGTPDLGDPDAGPDPPDL